jgi:hypothetical protein
MRPNAVGTWIIHMRWILIIGLMMGFAGCAHSVKQAAPTPAPAPTPALTAMSDEKAIEKATAAAIERGWKGPFEAYVVRSTERSESQWGDVNLTESGFRGRRGIVSIGRDGAVLDFHALR